MCGAVTQLMALLFPRETSGTASVSRRIPEKLLLEQERSCPDVNVHASDASSETNAKDSLFDDAMPLMERAGKQFGPLIT